jgi:hypothetical protein
MISFISALIRRAKFYAIVDGTLIVLYDQFPSPSSHIYNIFYLFYIISSWRTYHSVLNILYLAPSKLQNCAHTMLFLCMYLSQK